MSPRPSSTAPWIARFPWSKCRNPFHPHASIARGSGDRIVPWCAQIVAGRRSDVIGVGVGVGVGVGDDDASAIFAPG